MGKTRSSAAKVSFAREESIKLEPAMGACDHSWCDDRNKKYRLCDRVLNLAFPQCSGGNCLFVLPYSESSRRAAKLCPQFMLDD